MDKKTILLVDDEPFILTLLESLLSPSYDLITAKNGKEALEIAAKPDPRIHLVVSDIDFGDPNGIYVMEQVRFYNPEMPYILMSGRPDLHEKRALETGANHFLSKPYSRKALIQIVDQLLMD